ncbi:hypothetical protein Nepgr_010122 [Nepenthes gracilis]|uniref:Uncharacterized protein n=1 Tax=Nepenthes gracilis TaxID=150966 RepID=A0AAD3SCT6_NEPGR|nr:hypothetical protein Nepgr_010122 [Nepenthes gracilis]
MKIPSRILLPKCLSFRNCEPVDSQRGQWMETRNYYEVNSRSTQLNDFTRRTMYPKVKVREQNQEDPQDRQGRSLQKLKDFDSLSLGNMTSTVKEHKHISPPSTAEVPSSHTQITPPLSRGLQNVDKEAEVEDKPHIRASSILRPRAVLSSPDNDQMIGSKHKAKVERHSALKDHNSCQNRHSKCKVNPSNDTHERVAEGQAGTKEAAEQIHAQGKKVAAVSVRCRRANTRKAKPNLTRI